MGVSVIFARGLLSEVQNQGFDPDELLRRANIDGTRLADLRETLSIEEADLITREAMAITNDQGIGLTIGANAPESMLQVFGHLILAQSTIREAFAALRRYSGLLAEGPTWGLVERGDLALFTCEPALQLGDSTRCAVEYALAMTARIGHHFAPQNASLRQVHFQHRAPSYVHRYEEVFHCEVLFEQPTNALVFPREYIDLPQFHADDTVRTVLRETAERLLTERAQSRSVAQRVRTLLRYERDLAEVNVERIARHVGLSSRALRRRLGSEGSPLSSLVDEARCRIACDELRRPDTTIKETAELLGFSEPSAFHRAFKRWTGRTPAEFSRISESSPPGGALIDAVPAHASLAESRPQAALRSV
ncbi:MAG: AraC family transcriptional regulator [Myxococcaceae bacterium]|nr:AraC family transcriptional regulator [Myxococcaceae bacterium]